MGALWLVNQLWIIVPVNPRKNRVVYKFFSCSTNIPRGLSAYKPQKLVAYCLNILQFTQTVRSSFLSSVSTGTRQVVLQMLWFPPLLKNQHFQIPIRSGLLSSALYHDPLTEVTRRGLSARFSRLLSTDRITSPLTIGEIFVPNLYRQNYLAADDQRDFGSFIMQTELPRRWSPASFSFLLYTDRITSSLIIGEFLVSSSYRQNYLAADYRRVFGFFFVRTKLPRRWSSASFSFLLYTDRITSPLIIGEFLVSSLYRQNYLAADHRRVVAIFFIQTELSRRWSSASFWYLLYTDRIA